jgi:hypothetical protein
MSWACRSPRSSKPRAQAVDDLAPGHVGAVGVGHAELQRQQAAQQAPGAQLAVGLRAQGEHLAILQRGHQFAQQPALAQAGVADQRQGLQLPGLAGAPRCAAGAALGVAAHQRRGQALQPALDAGRDLRSSAARTR